MQNASIDDIAANVPADHMLGDKELYLASYKKMHEAHSPDGLITKEGAQIVHDVLAAFLPEVKAANIKVEDTYDNRFVEAALKKWQGQDVKRADSGARAVPHSCALRMDARPPAGCAGQARPL